jgi:subtilisin family serine protease
MHDVPARRRAVLLAAVLSALGSGLASAPAATAAAAAPTQPYIVVLKTASPTTGREATADLAAEEDVRPKLRFSAAVRGFSARLDATDVRHLRQDRRVAAVVPDRPVAATAAVPVAAGESVPSGIRRTGAVTGTAAREAASVNVAVLDTGIDLGHPDLNAVAGKDCTGGGSMADGNGHGTHVAGTIGARNTGSGVVGIAPGTRLWAVKVLGANGSGSTSGIICGIDWVTATRKDADPSNDIAVANLSLGGSAPPTTDCGRGVDPMHTAICASVAAGVTYVVAAGNSGTDLQSSVPASYPEVLTVTAMADSDGLPGGRGGPACGLGDDTAASFSNFATRAADAARVLAAPGACIRSTAPGGGTATMSGTSMASPHVAGLVALCHGDGATPGPCRGKAPADVAALLRRAAVDATAADGLRGFAGDPARPVAGRTYGHLAVALTGTGAGTPTPPPVTPPAATAPTVTGAPALSGSPAVGATLSSTTGTWTGTAPLAFARQWLRCAGASCTAIAGATATTYTVAAADAGFALRVRVTASNTAGSAVAESASTAAVPAPGGPPVPTASPAITGTPRPGATLTVTPGTWRGAQPMTLTYAWASCPPGSNVCWYVGGATTASLVVPASAPAGTRYVAVVTARNGAGAATVVTAPTAGVVR